jgi:hypothetical protein
VVVATNGRRIPSDPFGNDVNGDCSPDLVVGAPGLNQLLILGGPADGIFDNDPPLRVLTISNNAGGGLGLAAAIAPRARADGRRTVYFSRSTAASPEVSSILLAADFQASTPSVDLVRRANAASGLGAVFAVADAGDDLGVLLAAEPTLTTNAVTGALLGAPLQALPANQAAIRTLEPSALGNATAGTFAGRIARVADRDGDGVGDFVVGSPGLVVGGVRIGAYFVSGRTFTVIGSPLAAPAGTASFGAEVTAVGDLDGDGVEDLAFGAPDDGVGTVRGRVFLQLSTTPAALRPVEVPSLVATARARFGFAIAATGDVDGDGRNELLIGAPMDAGKPPAASDVPGCDAFHPQAHTGDCAGGVYILPSTHLGDNGGAPTAFACFFPAPGRAGRAGTALRALGPSLDPTLAANHQRLAIGAPGLGVDDPATTPDDSLGSVFIMTFTWSEATVSCLVNAPSLTNNTTGSLFGAALAH